MICNNAVARIVLHQEIQRPRPFLDPDVPALHHGMNQLVADLFSRRVARMDDPVPAVRALARQSKLFVVVFAFVKLNAKGAHALDVVSRFMYEHIYAFFVTEPGSRIQRVLHMLFR